ncbi:MAG: hypothetical protein ACRCZO_16185 [Cetobacterium sp.]
MNNVMLWVIVAFVGVTVAAIRFKLHPAAWLILAVVYSAFVGAVIMLLERL